MSVRILVSDCRDMLRTLDAGSAQTCVTSPPYFGLRDYGHAGQIGLEPTPDEFIAAMVAVFREMRRVLADDGTLWLNLGDSYNAQPNQRKVTDKAGANQQSNKGSTGAPSRHVEELKAKDLLMIPARVALALQADGWWLRSHIIWSKPNPMPESVTDRPTSSHESIFLLTKSARYFYDAEAVKEDAIKGAAGSEFHTGKTATHQLGRASSTDREEDGKRNLRNVWTIASQPFIGAHFATFPPALIEPCIKAGTSEKGCCPHCRKAWVRNVERTVAQPKSVASAYGNKAGRNDGGRSELVGASTKTLGWSPSCDCPSHEPIPCTVLDPFGGAGTTGLVADRLGRNAILTELNPDYAAMAQARIRDEQPMFADVQLEAAE